MAWTCHKCGAENQISSMPCFKCDYETGGMKKQRKKWFASVPSPVVAPAGAYIESRPREYSVGTGMLATYLGYFGGTAVFWVLLVIAQANIWNYGIAGAIMGSLACAGGVFIGLNIGRFEQAQETAKITLGLCLILEFSIMFLSSILGLAVFFVPFAARMLATRE